MSDRKDSRSESQSAFEELRLKQQQQDEKTAAEGVPNRRYVGTKETLGFVIWDAAQSFNINIFSTRFITSIVGIDLGWQTLVNSINSVWDIINDIFFGVFSNQRSAKFHRFGG